MLRLEVSMRAHVELRLGRAEQWVVSQNGASVCRLKLRNVCFTKAMVFVNGCTQQKSGPEIREWLHHELREMSVREGAVERAGSSVLAIGAREFFQPLDTYIAEAAR